jgi:hypothetical protein
VSQTGQVKPSGQRFLARYPAQAASSGNSASNSWRDMGRSDDQRADMKEHYKNIVRAATPNHYILGDRAQRDKPF